MSTNATRQAAVARATMPPIVLDASKSLDPKNVGGKAYFLNLLRGQGLSVPPAVVLPVGFDMADADGLADWLGRTMGPPPWDLAVRSSAASEDSAQQSHAGEFVSILGRMDLAGLHDAVAAVRRSGKDMGVIVQALLDPLFAGVAFSMNPMSHMRCELSVSWTRGLADRLVSGEDKGWHLLLNQEQSPEGDPWLAGRDTLDQLRVVAHLLEDELDGPVDIEWVIDADLRLWIVQVRPAVLPASAIIPLDSLASFGRLPPLVRNHPKIRLRQLACTHGVRMAPAEVESWGRDRSDRAEPPAFEAATGTSVVLLHPERIRQEIIREFAPAEMPDADRFARTCRRYKVRRYPKSADALEAIKTVLGIGLASSWTAVAIVQAILDAAVTGIVRKSAAGYVVDVAQGHFVPKGVVTTSTLVLSPAKEIISATWRKQELIYRFCEGHVVTEEGGEAMELAAGDLATMLEAFDPLFDVYRDAALEFGMIEQGGGLRGYLIDVAEGDACGMDLGLEQIRSGVLSVGRCTGRLCRFDSQDHVALDKHLHNRPEHVQLGQAGVIVVARRASVDMLPYVGAPGVVGFIFEQGAVLAHLAVVLREKGIPAIALDDAAAFGELPVGALAELDASSAAVRSIDRIGYLQEP